MVENAPRKSALEHRREFNKKRHERVLRWKHRFFDALATEYLEGRLPSTIDNLIPRGFKHSPYSGILVVTDRGTMDVNLRATVQDKERTLAKKPDAIVFRINQWYTDEVNIKRFVNLVSREYDAIQSSG